MKPRKTWVLVADGARARVLENSGPGTGLSPAMNFDFAASHAPTRDFGADKPGRGQGPGGVAHHAKPPKADWHTFEKHVFAADVAKALDAACDKDAFDSLVLVAPPKTLGDLRQELGSHVKDRVTKELHKDLTHLTVHELGDHLEGAVTL